MSKRKPASPSPPPAPAAVSSLADLLRARGLQVGREQPAEPTPPPPVTPGEADLSGCGKILVRRERKGHGGKTVTIVEGLGLPAARLEELARSMRIAFGCGSRVDGGRVVLQGDLAASLGAWLHKRGARRVVVGN